MSNTQTIWIRSTKLNTHTMIQCFADLDLALSGLKDVQQFTSFLYHAIDCAGDDVRIESELLHTREGE